MSILIKGATLPEGKQSDILLEGNKISKIAPSLAEPADEKIDAKGKLLLPGFINTHAHSAMSLLRGFADDMSLKRWLETKIWPAEKKMSETDVYWGTMLAAAEMIRSGTTCFSDMYFHPDSVHKAATDSGMRAMVGYSVLDLGDSAKRKSELALSESFLKKHSKAKQGRVFVSVQPHAPNTCSKELLIASLEQAKNYNAKLHIHLSETRREVFELLQKTKMRPVDYLASLGFLSPNVILAHCVWLTKQEIKVLAHHGASVSHNPVSNMKLASGGVAPIPEMLESGVNVALGTDGAASNNSLSMFEVMKTASLLQKNMRWDEQSINAQQSFDFATRNGAKALGIDAGEIKEGKLADLILLDLNAPNMLPAHSLISNIVYSAHAGNVTDSIIDGKIVMRNRKVLAFDEEKVLEEAKKAAQRIAYS